LALGTFYADHFLEPNDCSNWPAALLGPSQDTLRIVTGLAHTPVSKINVSNEAVGAKIRLAFMAPLLMRNAHIYKAGQGGCKATGISRKL